MNSTIQLVEEYVYKNYPNLKEKPLIIKELDSHFQVLSHKDGSPLILSKQILN
jgi:hypothetical protein